MLQLNYWLQDGWQVFFETVPTVDGIKQDSSLDTCAMDGAVNTMHALNQIVEASARTAHLISLV